MDDRKNQVLWLLVALYSVVVAFELWTLLKC
jgi:hypothetical protein